MKDCIKRVEVDVDVKGNDFFAGIAGGGPKKLGRISRSTAVHAAGRRIAKVIARELWRLSLINMTSRSASAN